MAARTRKKNINFLECISDLFHGREPLCFLPRLCTRCWLYERSTAASEPERLHTLACLELPKPSHLLSHTGGCGSSGKALVALMRREGHSPAGSVALLPAASALSLIQKERGVRQNAAWNSA